MLRSIVVVITCLLLASFIQSSTASSTSAKPKKDFLILIHTKYGTMYAILYPETPKHKANFIKLAQEKAFDSTTFHRVISGFVIQGGDPNSKNDDPTDDGRGGTGANIPAEFGKSHQYGSIAAARMGDMVNPKKESNGSQFYIVHSKEGLPHLDGQYTVFGQIIKGTDIIDSIAAQPTNNGKEDAMLRDQPLERQYMRVEVQYLKTKKITKLTGYKY